MKKHYLVDTNVIIDMLLDRFANIRIISYLCIVKCTQYGIYKGTDSYKQTFRKVTEGCRKTQKA